MRRRQDSFRLGKIGKLEKIVCDVFSRFVLAVIDLLVRHFLLLR